MKHKEIVLIVALSLVTALSLFQPGCSKTPEPVDRPTKTPESTDLPQKAPEFAIDPQFDEAWLFSEGLAPVKVDGKWGFIKNPLEQ